jgi:hypothetical protein
MALSDLQLAVLKAMNRLAPRPLGSTDTVGAVLHRRLKTYTQRELSETVLQLNAMGLTEVPDVGRVTDAAHFKDLRQWITPKGWEALGIETIAPTAGSEPGEGG